MAGDNGEINVEQGQENKPKIVLEIFLFHFLYL